MLKGREWMIGAGLALVFVVLFGVYSCTINAKDARNKAANDLIAAEKETKALEEQRAREEYDRTHPKMLPNGLMTDAHLWLKNNLKFPEYEIIGVSALKSQPDGTVKQSANIISKNSFGARTTSHFDFMWRGPGNISAVEDQ